MKTSLRRNLIPEANRLLGLNLAEANRVELREDLERVKDQLQERMSRIREGFREWMDQINEYDDADQRQEKEDAFHRFRLEGTVACPEDIEDLLEEVRDLILNVGRKISRIMNPVMVPPLPIHPPNPIPLAGVPPIPALIAAQNDPVDQNGLAQDNLNEEVLALNQPPFVPVAFPQAPIIQNPNLDIEPSINLKVDLRRFDGNDPAEYSRFMASFQYHVGRRNASDSVKFDHLERQLDPPARNAIAGLELADESYQLALDILNKRYGQKPLIVERLNQRLMKLSLNNMQANELRRFLDELNKILAQLKTATGEINQNGTICSVIMSKFPSHVFMKLEEMKGSYDPWTVELLCDKFSLFVNQRESVADHTESKRSESEKYGKRKPGQPFDENGENTSPKGQEGQKKQNQPLFGGQSGTPSGQRRICNFCGEGHAPGSCLKYKTVDQRKSRILELRKCEKCLRSDHETKDCMVSGRCFVCRDPSHNGLFCPEKGRAESTTGMSVVNYPGTSQKAKYPTETGLNNRRKKVMLLTAVAEVRNPNNVNGITTRARIFLDSGNERTYITTSLARKLGLKTQFEEALKVQLFLNKTKRVNSSVVNLTMQLKDGSQLPIEANIVDQISGLITRFELGLDDKRAIKKDHAQYLADSYWEKPGFVPDILIGEDYFWNIVKGEKEELPSGLKLIPSTLGLLIGGLARSDSSQKEITVVQAQFSKVVISSQGTEPKSEEGILTVEAERKQDQGQPSVAEVLSSMESLETIGIKDSPYVNDDEIAMALFQKGFRRTENGRCQVELPFMENAEMLPDNYGLAKGRAKSLGRRFQLDPKIQRRYTEVIAQQLELEIIEETTDAQKETDVHYLPHHPVVREDKTTTKVRPVYDGSAKARASDLSINEVLYKCPDLLPKLVGILIRFRSMPIPMVADVEKAFLQVGIAPKHRDYLRFMYFRDPEKPPTDDNFIIYRFTRVPFGLICSPFLLEGSIAEHLKKNGSNLALQVQQNIYVDNVLIGAENSEEAIQKRIWCKELFEDIQMNLRAWTSNDETFNGQLPEEDGVKEGPYKLLGVGWDRKLDTIFLSKMTKPEKFTRRTLVGSIASLYDPLGLSLPVAFKGKVFLQKVLKSSKGSWDQSLPDELVKEWETVFSDMNLVAEVAIKRPILVADGSKAELFVFCDASIKA
ncbi:MAG: DUF1759 domain-containing protein [Gammaproteobacteria bacterium]|nr:DUF1759 domain-containing protein [Gammaproteobacteria bacterium]